MGSEVQARDVEAGRGTDEEKCGILAGSVNGKPRVFEARFRGSIPCPATKDFADSVSRKAAKL